MPKVNRWRYGVPLGSMFGTRHRMRDRVFGWGPIEVKIIEGVVYLEKDPESPGVPAKDISPWIEFKEV